MKGVADKGQGYGVMPQHSPGLYQASSNGGGGSQQSTGSEQEWATAMGALFGAGEMEEEDGEEAGAAEGQEEEDSEGEGSSQGGKMRMAHPAGCLEV